MKHIFPIATLLTLSTLIACTKDADMVSEATPSTSAGVPAQQLSALASSQARLSGANYSQSISLDTANKMLSSYLTSVGYPTVDTAIRSLSFDADTLRAYLQNREIVTLKFMIAHKPDYINSGKNGRAAGMNPGALTMIIVGMDDNQQTVLNSRGGVYDHLSNCPSQCSSGLGSPFLY